MTTKRQQLRRAPARQVTAKTQQAWIRSVAIRGGFLDGTEVDLHQGLNCLIGGKGSGKTTALELIRHVLRPEEERTPIVASLLERNLGAGIVDLTLETKHGVRYAVRRGATGPADVIDADGNPVDTVQLERDGIFVADVYGIHEIEEVANRPELQLGLIDRFELEASRGIANRIRSVAKELEENAVALRQIDDERKDLDELAGELASVEHQLKSLEEPGNDADAERINAAHALNAQRTAERSAMDWVRSDLSRAMSELESPVRALASRLLSRVDVRSTSGPNGALLREATHPVLGFADFLNRFLTEARMQVSNATGIVETHARTLAEAHAAQDREYRQLVAQSARAQKRISERQQLQHRLADMTARQTEIETRQTERRRLEDHRRELLEKLAALRDERFKLRDRVAKALNERLEGKVRVVVTQSGLRVGFKAYLERALQNSGLKYRSMLDHIVDRVFPARLAALVSSRNSVSTVAEALEIDVDKASKVVRALESRAYDLQTIDVDDRPEIQLYDQDRFKAAPHLSAGQGCTAVLSIVLLENERPLIIDQPEDNLDNEFLVDTVVGTLRRVKRTRQIIFATHNPNLVVVAAADRVHFLRSTGGHSTVAEDGTVDELKGTIERVLEGGRAAFISRKERYGH